MNRFPETSRVDAFWWRPSSPDEMFPGTLVLLPGRKLRLALYGAVVDGAVGRISLFGESVDGTRWTLTGCSLEHQERGSGSYAASLWDVGIVIEGEHIASINDAEFVRGEFVCPGLETWLGGGDFACSGGSWDSPESVRVSTPSSIVAHSASSKLSLGLRLVNNTDHADRSSIIIRSIASIVVRPDLPQGIGWFLSCNAELVQLCSFLAGVSESVASITLQLATKANDESSSLSRSVRVWGVVPWPGPWEDQLQGEPLLCAAGNSETISNLLSNWFELESAGLVALLDATLSVRSSHQLSEELAFLSLVHALEGFHRCEGNGKYMSDEDYAPLAEQIEGAIPKSIKGPFRQSLVSRLKYGNEVSLFNRLKDLAHCLDDSVRSATLPNWKRVLRMVTDFRNLISHGNKEEMMGRVSAEELGVVNAGLHVFITALVLTKLRVSPKCVVAAVQQDRRNLVRNVSFAVRPDDGEPGQIRVARSFERDRLRSRMVLDSSGDVVSREMELHPEAVRALRELYSRYHDVTGVPVSSNTTLLDVMRAIDPEIPEDEEGRIALVARDLRAAGIAEELVYAFEKTGLIVTEENSHMISPKDLKEWGDAITEWYEKFG